MNRYEKTLSILHGKNEIAFIPFASAGDPDLSTSETVFKTYIDSGADILEIGYPFTDPVADGPVNQRAANRAIESGLTHDSFFKLISAIRTYNKDIPIGILMYANSAHYIGYDIFCKRAADAGIDSLLVADMPPEESGELFAAMKTNNLETVYIVSELTPQKRMDYICKQVTGFVYVVSRLGTTGVHTALSTSVAQTLKRLKKTTAIPL
jgi:tryptophan synthase alpha chain